MTKENKKKEGCPLCGVSEETIARLREKKPAEKTAEKEKKKPSQNL